MKLLLSLALLFLIPTAALAQTAQADAPQVSGVNIEEFGLYDLNQAVKLESSPGTATGNIQTTSSIRLIEATRTVPAQQGATFGIRYTVIGAPAGAIVPLHMVTIFPAPGLRNPDTGQLSTRSEFTTNKAIGDSNFRYYNLTDAWEVVPGVWTFQIWYQDRKLAEQSFIVLKP